MDYANKIIGYIETHDVVGIRECFLNGVSPNDLFNGEPLIYELISEYTRGPRFRECVAAFVQFGLEFKEKPLIAVLLDDPVSLQEYIRSEPRLINTRYSLRCAYTPLFEVTLLHVCAEFNHVKCAEVLMENGADVNATAGIDEDGFGGQTPIFHTVNQNSNLSLGMMDFLIANSADLTLTVDGLVWGKSYEWETLIPAVNPISYAMMGLLPQMHRREEDISSVVSKLLKTAFGINYQPVNVPNKYLSG